MNKYLLFLFFIIFFPTVNQGMYRVYIEDEVVAEYTHPLPFNKLKSALYIKEPPPEEYDPTSVLYLRLPVTQNAFTLITDWALPTHSPNGRGKSITEYIKEEYKNCKQSIPTDQLLYEVMIAYQELRIKERVAELFTQENIELVKPYCKRNHQIIGFPYYLYETEENTKENDTSLNNKNIPLEEILQHLEEKKSNN